MPAEFWGQVVAGWAFGALTFAVVQHIAFLGSSRRRYLREVDERLRKYCQ